MWSKHRARVPRLLSVLVHGMMVALALIPLGPPPKRLPKRVINIALYAPRRLALPARSAPSGGRARGKHTLTPPSLGKLPRAADKQWAPRDPEAAKSPEPALPI